jgi:hypothetical protein
MTSSTRFFSLLLAALAMLAAPWAEAGMPTGTVGQLSGGLMAIRADGKIKLLGERSRVETGDRLVTEADSYARIAFDDGNDVIVGPATQLTLAGNGVDSTLWSLQRGSLQVTSPLAGQPPGRRVAVLVDGGSIEVGMASFTVTFLPASPEAVAERRRAYLQASVAAAAPRVLSDSDAPAWQGLLAQLALPPRGPTSLPPGLYVHVIDGLISLANPVGSQSFSAGQFGYVASPRQPPVIVPPNPGLHFTPPPSFNSSPVPAAGTRSVSSTVDCVVR